MSITSRFLKGSLSLGIATVVVRLSGILVLVPLARILGSEQLGIYSLVFWASQSGMAIGLIGVDVAMHRNGAQIYKTDPSATGRLLGAGSLLLLISYTTLSLCLFIFRFYLAEHWLGNRDSALWLGFAATILFIDGMGLIAITGLLSLHDFRGNSFASSVGAIGRLLLSPLLAWQYGLGGALVGSTMASLLQCLAASSLFRGQLRKYNIKMHCTGFIKESQEILKFGIPFWSGNALIALLTLPIMGEIGRIAGVGALGQFRIAQSLSQVVGFLPGAIAPVVVSVLSESYKPNENTNDFEKLRSLHMRGNWLLALTLVMFLSLNSNLIVNMLYGKAYIDAVPLVIGMGWLSLINVVVGNLNLYTLSAGNTLTIAIASLSQKAIVIGFSFWLIPKLQTIGYIVAMISGASAQLVIMGIYTWKKISRILKQQSIKLFVWSITIFAMTSLSQLSQLATSRNLFLSGGITIIFFVLIIFTTFELPEIKKLVVKLENIYSNLSRIGS